MTNAAMTHPNLVHALWPAHSHNRLLRAVFLVVLGSMLMTVSAKVQVPFWPVPMTMQTAAALLIGATLGWRLAGATVVAYLAQGTMGLPVFAGGGGIAYLAGPTGGYLVGFLAAAVAVGWLAERGWDRSLGSALIAMAVGVAIIFLLGVGYLATLIGFNQAIAAGLLPFLPAEALKIALVTAIMPLAWRGVRRRNR